MMESEKENKRFGIIGTILFHVLLMILFMWKGLSQPDPLPEQEGAELMLGWTDTGMGEIVPNTATESSTVAEEVPSEAEPVTDNTEVVEEVETQTESDVAVTKPTEPKPKENKPKQEETKPVEKPAEEPKPQNSQELNNAMSDMWNNNPSPSNSGSAGGDGNAGKPDGSPKGRGVLGGSGTEWSLAGRSYLGGIVTEKPREEGVVAIEIKVSRDGKVISAEYYSPGSKSMSPHLINIAKKAARGARFNVSPESSVEQIGIITFHFKLK